MCEWSSLLPFPFVLLCCTSLMLLLHLHFPYASHAHSLKFSYTPLRLPLHFPYTSIMLPLSFSCTSLTLPTHFPCTSITLPFCFPYASLMLLLNLRLALRPVQLALRALWQTDAMTDGRPYGISPHSTGLCPLSGPLPNKKGNLLHCMSVHS